MTGSPSAGAAAPRVVMFDILSGNNDYSAELVRALGKTGPLTVVTVENSRIAAQDCTRLLRVIPAFASPQARVLKALRMALAYLCLVGLCLYQPRRTVLHVQMLRFEKLEAVLFGALQWFGVKILHTAHNALPHMEAPWHAAFYTRWYAGVDAVHVLSRSVRDEIVHGLGVTPRQVAVIGHGPYTSMRHRFGAIDVAARRRELGIAPDRCVILQYGLFKEYKGLDRIAAALVHMPAEVRPLLVLAGGGPAGHLADIRQRIEDAGRGDCLLWLQRFVSDDELCGLIGVADLVVFPYQKVSQSGALYLAMTFGKPCLCSDLPGFREALPDGDEAFVDTADSSAFAARLTQLMASPAALAGLQAMVAACALRGFNWQQIAHQTWQLYADMARVPRR